MSKTLMGFLSAEEGTVLYFLQKHAVERNLPEKTLKKFLKMFSEENKKFALALAYPDRPAPKEAREFADKLIAGYKNSIKSEKRMRNQSEAIQKVRDGVQKLCDRHGVDIFGIARVGEDGIEHEFKIWSEKDS